MKQVRFVDRRAGLRAAAVAGWLALAAALPASAQSVAMTGSMGSKALLVVDGGAPKALAAGETHRGVKVVAVRALPGTDEEVLLVPLTGHTRGHCGVAVRTDRGWLLHCGDAYFFRGEMAPEPHCPIGLSLFQSLLQMHGPSRIANQKRLRELKQAHGDEVTLFSAHDPVELSNMRTRDHRLPARTAAHAA